MAEPWRESEIVANLFVGDLQDARNFEGMVISVLPDLMPEEPAGAIHMPILANGIVSMESTAALIDQALGRGTRVLVHCEEGCERAPLVVAWYLRARRGMTMDEAYALLRSRRPIVKDRRRWLNEEG